MSQVTGAGALAATAAAAVCGRADGTAMLTAGVPLPLLDTAAAAGLAAAALARIMAAVEGGSDTCRCSACGLGGCVAMADAPGAGDGGTGAGVAAAAVAARAGVAVTGELGVGFAVTVAARRMGDAVSSVAADAEEVVEVEVAAEETDTAVVVVALLARGATGDVGDFDEGETGDTVPDESRVALGGREPATPTATEAAVAAAEARAG